MIICKHRKHVCECCCVVTGSICLCIYLRRDLIVKNEKNSFFLCCRTRSNGSPRPPTNKKLCAARARGGGGIKYFCFGCITRAHLILFRFFMNRITYTHSSSTTHFQPCMHWAKHTETKKKKLLLILRFSQAQENGLGKNPRQTSRHN